MTEYQKIDMENLESRIANAYIVMIYIAKKDNGWLLDFYKMVSYGPIKTGELIC